MAEEEYKSNTTIILSAVIVEYGAFTRENQKTGARELCKRRNVMKRLIQKHRGRMVDAPDDRMLAVFIKAVDAVDAAVEIQRKMAERNAELMENRKIRVKIGISTQDMSTEGKPTSGNRVTNSTRISGQADPGGICITAAVYDAMAHRTYLECQLLENQGANMGKKSARVYRLMATFDFNYIHEKEKEKLEIGSTKDAMGLALSGGGIRSASFGLGVIQAMLEHGIMQNLDYMSTVSGGGYIGASLTWYRQFDRIASDFLEISNPFGAKGTGVRSSLNSLEKNKNNYLDDNSKTNSFLSYIRQHGDYLTPNKWLTLFSFIGIILRNFIISLVIYLPFLFVTISLWTLVVTLFAGIIYIQRYENIILNKELFIYLLSKGEWEYDPFFYMNISIALLILLLFIFSGFLFSWSTFHSSIRDVSEKYQSYMKRYISQSMSGILLKGFIIFLLAASVPIIDDLFDDWYTKTVGIGIVGCISGLWAAISKFRKFLGGESLFKKASWIGERLFEVGAFIFLYAMVVLSYRLFLELIMHITENRWTIIIVALIFILALSLALFVDINYASLGRMYRDRLMEAFLPDDQSVENNFWGLSFHADSTLIENMCKENDHLIRKPYHLINTNVILTNSKKEKYRRRGGDSFLLSPLYCGSHATGFIKTKCFMKKKNKGGMTLATAMAISGAAVNPRTGVGGKGPTKGALVSILMTIFNLRLGAWISNPNKNGAPYRWMNYLMPGLCSLFCAGYHENNRYLELTDGGHFENLGLYELIRRRVGTIFVSDAGVDKDFKFGDLANAIEKVKKD
jgi:hypothetical protein